MTTFRIKTRKISTLGVALLLSTAIASPVFAHGAIVRLHHARAYDQQFGGATYDNAPQTPEEMRNLQNFGFSGHCPSCVGGEDPALNPAG
jgi:hypothetical protein